MDKSFEERLDEVLIEPQSKITTIISGGMDSVTLLYHALSKTSPDKIFAISFNYGQKHKKELECAKAICNQWGINHNIVDLSQASLLLKSSLTSNDQAVPHGHYAEQNMKQTVVPNRNAIMLSIAYGAAISNGSKYLLYGAHTGDHFIYPDCRPEFVEALDKALKIGNEGFGDVSILAPFKGISKSEIVTLGVKLKVPYQYTWSCYEGNLRPCGQCGTCVERVESFLDNNLVDPLLTNDEWVKAVKYHNEASKKFKSS